VSSGIAEPGPDRGRDVQKKNERPIEEGETIPGPKRSGGGEGKELRTLQGGGKEDARQIPLGRQIKK